MLRFLTIACLVCAHAGAVPVVMDRVAVVVGRRVVKTSDIDRDLRASQLLNRQPLDLSAKARKAVAERLVDQELIRQELQNGNYSLPSSDDVNAFAARLRQDRFGGSEAQLNAGLRRYGLTADEFRQYLYWQLSVLRFIDERFRPGVLVTDEDVRAYYDEHRAELARANPGKDSLEALEPKIRDILFGERVNQNFEEWLRQTRRQTRVQYRPAAFGETASAQEVSKP